MWVVGVESFVRRYLAPVRLRRLKYARINVAVGSKDGCREARLARPEFAVTSPSGHAHHAPRPNKRHNQLRSDVVPP
jgi:hypothetical protein